MMMMMMLLLLAATLAAVAALSGAARAAPVVESAAKIRPVVLWHGMGDTCCFPFSMGKVKKYIEEQLPGVFVHSIEVGDSIEADEIAGFIGNVNQQLDYVHKQLAAIPELANGFNAVGFSQGGQFFRGYIERYQHVGPAVHNFVSMGGQHFGVTDIPSCETPTGEICKVVLDILQLGVYNSFVQDHVVQAQYFRDPMEIDTYYSSGHFLADINAESTRLPVNPQYKKNLVTLNHMALFMFGADTVVVPRESEWFWSYAPGSLSKLVPMVDQPIYKEDRIGLKVLNETKRLSTGTVPGAEHMQFTLPWFLQNVITPFFNNTLP